MDYVAYDIMPLLERVADDAAAASFHAATPLCRRFRRLIIAAAADTAAGESLTRY